MEPKTHFRKRSELCRTRLLSDFYFENKHQKKRSASLAKEILLQTPTELNTHWITPSLTSQLKTIQKLINPGLSSIRTEELPLFQAFFCILDPDTKIDSFQDLTQALKSQILHSTIEKFISFSRIPKKNSKEPVHNSLKFYSQINKTLYGYPLTRSISSFIETCYKACKMVFREVRFIDYFENLPNPPAYLSSPVHWVKLFSPDFQIETTKDDEENMYMNTLGDDKDYENLLETEAAPILNTEPDCRNVLNSMFFQKYEGKNSYLRPVKAERVGNRQELLMRIDPKVKSAKWNKYFSESIYLKKLGIGFVEFVMRRSGKEEGMDLVSWVYKNRNEMIEEYLKENGSGEGIDKVKYLAIIKHLSDKKTLRDLFKQC